MRRAWREHSLAVTLALVTLVCIVAGTVATWHEFATNEGIGMDGKAEFWSSEFLAYWSMQLMMNYVPELLGLLTFLILAAQFHDRWQRESEGDGKM